MPFLGRRAGASGTGIWSRHPVLNHAQFRHLLSGGYRDAAEQAGAGFVPTYPTDYPCPPLLTLDHVVTHHVMAHAVSSVRLPGSDHRGLQVELVLPPLR